MHIGRVTAQSEHDGPMRSQPLKELRLSLRGTFALGLWRLWYAKDALRRAEQTSIKGLPQYQNFIQIQRSRCRPPAHLRNLSLLPPASHSGCKKA